MHLGPASGDTQCGRCSAMMSVYREDFGVVAWCPHCRHIAVMPGAEEVAPAAPAEGDSLRRRMRRAMAHSAKLAQDNAALQAEARRLIAANHEVTRVLSILRAVHNIFLAGDTGDWETQAYWIEALRSLERLPLPQ